MMEGLVLTFKKLWGFVETGTFWPLKPPALFGR
jgi:hypothetical protein